MRWQGASRTTIDVRGTAPLATVLRYTLAAKTPACLRRGPILPTHAWRPPGPGRPGLRAFSDFVSIATETLRVADETVEFTTEELPTATESQMGKIAAIWRTNLVLANRCVAVPTHSLPWSLKAMPRASRSTDRYGFLP